ncbi:MAG TPA: PAS domain S-box protein [Terriglobales bacterium]
MNARVTQERSGVFGNIFRKVFLPKTVRDTEQESEQKFRYLFSEAPIGIALEDLNGNLLFVNPALCSMLGYQNEEMTRMNCSEFADGEDEQEDWRAFEAMRSGTIRAYRLEKRYRRKDGSKMWGRLNVSLLNVSEQQTFVLATVEDVTEKRVALEELKRAHSELQQLTPRLLSAQEQERQRIARELHDDIGQRLALLTMRLDVLGHNLPIERTEEHVEIRNLLGDLDELTTDIHNLSHKLHSSKLEHLGLGQALNEVCRQLSSQYRIPIDLTTSDVPDSLDGQISLTLYRVAQEALSNAVKHSGTARIEVSFSRDKQVLRMRIRDFGTGFDPTIQTNGIGLVTMQERLRMIGGTVGFNPVTGGGTDVEAEINFEQAARSARAA